MANYSGIQQKPAYQDLDAMLSRHDLPNAKSVLILGIFSLAFCWLHLLSVIGIVLSVATLVISSRTLRLYKKHPERFTLSSLNIIKTGRICALIGLFISLIVFSTLLFITLELMPMMPFWGMTK
jgi:hypothetical protein